MPIARPSRALLLALGIAAVAAAGCGGGEQRVETKPFADDVCSAFLDFQQDLEQMESDLQEEIGDSEDPERLVDGLTDYLGRSAERVAELRDEVADAGVPDIESGEEAADDLQEALAGIEQLFRQARDEASTLPVDDRAALEEGVIAIAQDLQEGSTEIEETFERLNSEYPELEDVDVESCEQLG